MFLAEQGEWFLVTLHMTTDFFFCHRSLESAIEAGDDKEEEKNIRKILSRNRRESLSEEQKKTSIKEVEKSEKGSHQSMHQFVKLDKNCLEK